MRWSSASSTFMVGSFRRARVRRGRGRGTIIARVVGFVHDNMRYSIFLSLGVVRAVTRRPVRGGQGDRQGDPRATGGGALDGQRPAVVFEAGSDAEQAEPGVAPVAGSGAGGGPAGPRAGLAGESAAVVLDDELHPPVAAAKADDRAGG